MEQLVALVPARAGERIERRGEGFEDAGVARAALAVVELDRVFLHDDALEREQAVDAGRRHAGLGGDFLGDADGRGERGRIDLEAAGAVAGVEGQRRLDRTALEALARQRARGGFDTVEARRHAQANVEPAAVDALRFPAPARAVAAAMRFGESGHAYDGHARKIALRARFSQMDPIHLPSSRASCRRPIFLPKEMGCPDKPGNDGWE